jgi:hypothetical protein
MGPPGPVTGFTLPLLRIIVQKIDDDVSQSVLLSWWALSVFRYSERKHHIENGVSFSLR